MKRLSKEVGSMPSVPQGKRSQQKPKTMKRSEIQDRWAWGFMSVRVGLIALCCIAFWLAFFAGISLFYYIGFLGLFVVLVLIIWEGRRVEQMKNG